MRFGKYTFRCVFENNAILPSYKGSSLRGVFGHSLKNIVCALKKKTCCDCLLSAQCVYPSLFETVAGRLNDVAAKEKVRDSRPYVIEPPDDARTHYEKGEHFDFALLLFGKANEYLPYFIYAFDQMGEVGIGKKNDGKRASFYLEKVFMNDCLVYSRKDKNIRKQIPVTDIVLEPDQLIPLAKEMRLKIKLVTPLRLKYRNSLKADLPFHVLIRAVLRRLSLLFEIHDGGEPELDYRGLVKRSKSVLITENKIQWFDWRRYSNKQEQAMLMGGMIGSVEYRGQLSEFLPLIKIAEEVHIGKQTTFGLGKIKIETLH